MLGGRIWDACQKYQIKNFLALWVFGASRTLWFSTVSRERSGQIEWAEKIAEEFARVGDIRLMSDLTIADIKTMELVWGQAAARLDTYAANKKPEPKLPTKPEPMPQPKPVENGGKKEAEKEPEKKGEPKPSDEKGSEPVEEPKKSGTMKVIGSIATVLALIVAWLPIPAPIKAIAKVILSAIASIFK